MLSSAILRRSVALGASKKTLGIATTPSLSSLGAFDGVSRRFKSDDVGDVIGIDLGTTNSCVSIMVRKINNTKQIF
jgi:hypothetical protein